IRSPIGSTHVLTTAFLRRCPKRRIWLGSVKKTCISPLTFHRRPIGCSVAAPSNYHKRCHVMALPHTPQTDAILQRLAGLQPKTLAIMHGSSFAGDGERALRDLAVVMRETLGDPPERR